jgi:serine/threonine-protein kinase
MLAARRIGFVLAAVPLALVGLATSSPPAEGTTFLAQKVVIAPTFVEPHQVAVDSAGDIFVANTYGNDVLELAAGSMTYRVLPFTGLFRPAGVAVDTAGDVFVGQVFGPDPDLIELPAGSHSQVTIPFNGADVTALAVDHAGDLFVRDNQGVVELPSGTGSQVLLAGAPPDVPESFVVGEGLAVDNGGDVFFTTQDKVEEITAGSTDAETLPFTHIDQASGVAVDTSGDVYVSSAFGGQVDELPAGSTDQITLPFDSSNFTPSGLAIDRSGNLIVSSIDSRVLLEFRSGSAAATPLPALPGVAFVQGVAVDRSGNLFVADTGDAQVLELPAGATQYQVLPFAGLVEPSGVGVDSRGDVFVADETANKVFELPAGASTSVSLPFSDLNAPNGIVIDAKGDVFVTNFDADGEPQLLELPSGSESQIDLPVPAGNPSGVAVDDAGDIFVAIDNGSNPGVFELPVGATAPEQLPFGSQPGGVAVDSAGDIFSTSLFTGVVSELAAGASTTVTLPITGLGEPVGIAVDSAGDVYVADEGSSQVVELEAQQPQTISFTSTPPSPAYYGGTYTVTASGGGSGEPVTFTAAAMSVCTVSGSIVTFTGVGTCTIDANQIGNSSYLPAKASQGITVNPASLKITASSPTVTYGQAIPAITASYSGFVNGDSASSSGFTGPACTAQGAGPSPQAGTYTTSCSEASDTDYDIIYDTGTLTVDKAATTTSAAAATAELSGTSWSVPMSAKLTSNVTTKGISGATLVLSIGSGSSAKNCSATTNAQGVANCSVSYGLLANIPSNYTASFAGSTDYLPSSQTATVTSGAGAVIQQLLSLLGLQKLLSLAGL